MANIKKCGTAFTKQSKMGAKEFVLNFFETLSSQEAAQDQSNEDSTKIAVAGEKA